MRSGKRLRKKKEQAPSIWLTIYSDWITNLTLFFILLFSTSLMAMQKGMGKGELDEFVQKMVSAVHKGENRAAVTETMDRLLKIEGISGEMINDHEMKLVVLEDMLFDPGRAYLKKDSHKVLDRVGENVAKLKHAVVVEGHTSDREGDAAPPFHARSWEQAIARSTGFGRYRTPWELSAARSIKVVEYLVFRKYVAPDRLAAGSCGPSFPQVPNTSDENRARNRRIEIRLMEKG